MLVIVWFNEITAADVDRVGGKGANLGECVRAGLPVPPGFCVSTTAYREATGKISRQLLNDAARGDAEAARTRVLALPMPDSVRAAVAKAYVRLGELPVAVRSSATAEDLADASFAGQQDTYLGVLGIEAVLDAVRRCWASLWTDRAVDYRRQRGIAEDDLALAVVIQKMVDAEAAGVLFTRDPVTGDDATMLASSSYGLGESVVAALVTPDTFTLSRRPAAVVAARVGSKETRIDSTRGGATVTTEVSPGARRSPSVTEEQLLRLLDLGEQIEDHYGGGQDVEWAFADDELYLLQARSITTSLAPTEGHAPVRGRIQRFVRDDLIEHYPAPFPLDLMAAQRVTEGALRAFGFEDITVSLLLAGDDEGIIRISAARVRIPLTRLVRLPRIFLAAMRRDAFGWPRDERALKEEMEAFVRRVQGVASASDQELVDLVRATVDQAGRLTGIRFVRYLAPMMVHRFAAAMMLRAARKGADLTPEDLYAGVAYKTAEIVAGFDRLADLARGRGLVTAITMAPEGEVSSVLGETSAGQEFLAAVEAFLASHGARTARLYLPFSNRSWREDPEAFYALLAAVLRGEPLGQAQIGDVARWVERQLPRFLRRRWRAATARLRARHIAREGTVYLIEELFCLARVGMDEIARRLVERRQIEEIADIRYLYFDEVEGSLQDGGRRLQTTIRTRQRRRATAEALWWDRGEWNDDDQVLRGVPASGGQAIGKARVVRSPDEFHSLQAGEVLVCPYTDPTWTPLFALAAAVVADSGGPLSHAAIVAREYGLPAVLGTGCATSLPDHAMLRVDGTRGTVAIVDDERA